MKLSPLDLSCLPGRPLDNLTSAACCVWHLCRVVKHTVADTGHTALTLSCPGAQPWLLLNCGAGAPGESRLCNGPSRLDQAAFLVHLHCISVHVNLSTDACLPSVSWPTHPQLARASFPQRVKKKMGPSQATKSSTGREKGAGEASVGACMRSTMWRPPPHTLPHPRPQLVRVLLRLGMILTLLLLFLLHFLCFRCFLLPWRPSGSHLSLLCFFLVASALILFFLDFPALPLLFLLFSAMSLLYCVCLCLVFACSCLFLPCLRFYFAASPSAASRRVDAPPLSTLSQRFGSERSLMAAPAPKPGAPSFRLGRRLLSQSET